MSFIELVRQLEGALEESRSRSAKGRVNKINVNRPVYSPLTNKRHRQSVIERDLNKARRWIGLDLPTSSSRPS